MVDVERDIIKAKGGAGGELVYKTITGLTSNLSVESKPVLMQSKNDKSATDTNDPGNIVLYNVQYIPECINDNYHFL